MSQNFDQTILESYILNLENKCFLNSKTKSNAKVCIFKVECIFSPDNNNSDFAVHFLNETWFVMTHLKLNSLWLFDL